MLEVTDGDSKRIASAAAKEALQEFMLMLGVDITTPAGIIDLQKDFHHVRETRRTVGNVRNKAWDVITASAVTGVITAIGFYLTHGMGK